MLTVFRLLLIPPMAYCLLEGRLAVAGVLFALAAISDFADGWIARRFNAATTFGRLVDPLADKLLVGTAVGLLWWEGMLPGWFALVVAARESFVLAASAFAKARGRTDLLRPDIFGKTGAAAEMLLVAMMLLPLPGELKLPRLLLGLMIAATAFTLVSGVRYTLRWRALRRRPDRP